MSHASLSSKERRYKLGFIHLSARLWFVAGLPFNFFLFLRSRIVQFTSMTTLFLSPKKSSRCILGHHWVTTGAAPWSVLVTLSP